MTDYTPTGKPDDGTRYDARAVRREFELIADGINSKSDLNSDSTVSSTSMLIESPATKTFTVETGKDFAPGQTVFIADSTDPATNNMTGTLTSYARDTSGIMVVSVTSKNGSGTKSAWNIGVSNVSGVTLVNNTFAGHQNFARATVASAATTADIWGALGNQIDFTGIATVTAFPAAAQAGASRKLICTAGCSFTAGANLIIDGYASGKTMTCVANDVVTVEAITTTQFKLRRERTDGFPILAAKGTSILQLHTGNGHGSTNDKIRRFTTVVTNTGGDWTYTDSATLGANITIITSGVYYGMYMDREGGAGAYGFSRNSSQLTTAFESINETDKLLTVSHFTTTAGNSFTRYLAAGDVIRMHTDGSVTDAAGVNRVILERLF